MPTPETRTEHEARAAAAAAKARAALTPRSTSSGQAHYGELRQKVSLLALYTAALLATSILSHCSPALKTPDSVKAASHSSMLCVIDCRTPRAALQCRARVKIQSCRCP